MANILSKIFGSKKDRDVKLLKPLVEKINSLEPWAKGLKKEDFPVETEKLRNKITNGESMDSVMFTSFALAREASFRVLGERPYDVQIMGAIVLHQGKILEMKTGEGKTLTSVPAAYLNALGHKGVQIITVNDYLAERDSKWMKPVYEYLGLTVGCILSNMDNERKKQSYQCDIVYGTNNEFGFDYLRDNMKVKSEDKLQMGHHFCIIDEIDSILVDEARTPLIISGQGSDDTQIVRNAEKITGYFTECEKDPVTGEYPEITILDKFDEKNTKISGDYMLDEKSKKVSFSAEGMEKMDEILQKHNIITGSVYEDENFEYIHYVTQALTAKLLYKKDSDYIVRDNKIQIVDEFTGRVLEGRRYSEGLHQAIEAKEHIKVYGRNKTIATITFQNFFRMYDKLSGMTGTAETEAIEFQSIYDLDVVVIPTNEPIARVDANDQVYLNEEFKLKAIVDEIERVHKTGQPILVGTISIDKSELLSKLLRQRKIPHEVLNAKNHAREALIIENAGCKDAVTIATNMAGRGTDIKLGGSVKALARKICPDENSENFKSALEKVKDEYKKRYEEVKSLGGLYILGTERHESRRIDNQLRGRSGRQGDPGFSRFYVSFDDNLLRLFAKDSIKGMIGRLGMNTGEPIEHSMVNKVIESAQKKVEERNYEIRKYLLDYDDVLSEQRNLIYSQRDEILNDDDLLTRLVKSTNEIVDGEALSFTKLKGKELMEALANAMLADFNFIPKYKKEMIDSNFQEIVKNTKDQINTLIKLKSELVGELQFNNFIRFLYLQQIDGKWQDQLSSLEELRDAVRLRSIAQKNPLVEYKIEGYDMFQDMIEKIKLAVISQIIRVKIKVSAIPDKLKEDGNVVQIHESIQTFTSEERRARSNLQRNGGGPATESIKPKQIIRTQPKVGRNDPCPCGSGKKYKNCCGKNV